MPKTIRGVENDRRTRPPSDITLVPSSFIDASAIPVMGALSKFMRWKLGKK